MGGAGERENEGLTGGATPYSEGEWSKGVLLSRSTAGGLASKMQDGKMRGERGEVGDLDAMLCVGMEAGRARGSGGTGKWRGVVGGEGVGLGRCDAWKKKVCAVSRGERREEGVWSAGGGRCTRIRVEAEASWG